MSDQTVGQGRRFLIPVDNTEASDRVCDWAIENLFRAGDAFTLLTVVPTGQYVVLSTDLGMEEVLQDDPALLEAMDQKAYAMLDQKFTAKLEAAKVPFNFEVSRFATDNDSIGSIIIKRAEQLNAASIIIAKHTRGAIQEFFVGSVTSYLTRHSRAPVMVLHCD